MLGGLLLVGLAARLVLLATVSSGVSEGSSDLGPLELALALVVLALLALEVVSWCSFAAARAPVFFLVVAWVQLALWILAVPGLAGGEVGLLWWVPEAVLQLLKLAAYGVFPKSRD